LLLVIASMSLPWFSVLGRIPEVGFVAAPLYVVLRRVRVGLARGSMLFKVCYRFL